MESANKNTKTIIIIAGVAVTAIGLLFLLRKSPKKSRKTSSLRQTLTQPEKTAIIQQIKVEYDGENRLTPTSVIAIVEATRKLGSADYVNLTWETRNTRRAVAKDNLEAFARVCEEHLKKVQLITEQNEADILNHLGIPKATWDQTTAYYLTQGNNQIMNFQSDLAEKQVSEMGCNKVLTSQEFQAVIKRHIELLEKEKALIPIVKPLLAQPENAVMVVQEKINDEIFQEFGVEDEDFVSAIEKYNSSQECFALFQNFLHASMNLVS